MQAASWPSSACPCAHFHVQTSAHSDLSFGEHLLIRDHRGFNGNVPKSYFYSISLLKLDVKMKQELLQQIRDSIYIKSEMNFSIPELIFMLRGVQMFLHSKDYTVFYRN